jgi:hypothetical protein
MRQPTRTVAGEAGSSSSWANIGFETIPPTQRQRFAGAAEGGESIGGGAGAVAFGFQSCQGAGLPVSLIHKSRAGVALPLHGRQGGAGPAALGGLLDGRINLA